jgi:hypothetical protein
MRGYEMLLNAASIGLLMRADDVDVIAARNAARMMDQVSMPRRVFEQHALRFDRAFHGLTLVWEELGL